MYHLGSVRGNSSSVVAGGHALPADAPLRALTQGLDLCGGLRSTVRDDLLENLDALIQLVASGGILGRLFRGQASSTSSFFSRSRK